MAASLAPLGRSGDDLLDRWDGQVLLRTAKLAGLDDAVAYRACEVGHDRTVLAVDLPERAASAAGALEAHVRHSLLSDTTALEDLALRDPAVGRLWTAYPDVVPVLFRDPFMAIVRSISAQQVNLRWAVTIRRRLVERYGLRLVVGGGEAWRLEPGPLAEATIAELRDLQLTTAKARSVIECARAAQDGALDLAMLERLSDDDVIAHLTTLRGIGPWSAEWFLARTLGRPRVVAGALGVRKAIGRLYDTPGVPAESDVRRLTEHWGAAATHAQALALHDLAERAQGGRA